MNDNTVAVMDIVAEIQNFPVAVPTFFHYKIFSTCKNLKQLWNRTYVPQNRPVMHILKTVLQSAFNMHMTVIRHQSLITTHIRQINTFI